MSKYRITLEGKTYEMEIELLAENDIPRPAAKQESKQVNIPRETGAAPVAKKQAVNEKGVVTAPMPGTVIRIEKGEGQTVKADELVLILEAMKMENEILAPADGTITAMNCTAGGTVAGGDVLFEVK